MGLNITIYNDIVKSIDITLYDDMFKVNKQGRRNHGKIIYLYNWF